MNLPRGLSCRLTGAQIWHPPSPFISSHSPRLTFPRLAHRSPFSPIFRLVNGSSISIFEKPLPSPNRSHVFSSSAPSSHTLSCASSRVVSACSKGHSLSPRRSSTSQPNYHPPLKLSASPLSPSHLSSLLSPLSPYLLSLIPYYVPHRVWRQHGGRARSCRRGGRASAARGARALGRPCCRSGSDQ